MSGPYRVAYDRVLPHARQVADPFHVVRLANRSVDLVRRRVQNETLGHRGRKADPLYRKRRLLTMTQERFDAAVIVASKASCRLVTLAGKYATPGTLKKQYGTSTKSTALT